MCQREGNVIIAVRMQAEEIFMANFGNPERKGASCR